MINRISQKHKRGWVLCLFDLKMVVLLSWLPKTHIKAMLMLKEILKLLPQEQCHHRFNVACVHYYKMWVQFTSPSSLDQ
jgi:hypothetical protein